MRWLRPSSMTLAHPPTHTIPVLPCTTLLHFDILANFQKLQLVSVIITTMFGTTLFPDAVANRGSAHHSTVAIRIYGSTTLFWIVTNDLIKGLRTLVNKISWVDLRKKYLPIYYVHHRASYAVSHVIFPKRSSMIHYRGLSRGPRSNSPTGSCQYSIHQLAANV